VSPFHRHKAGNDPIRMVLDDETVERLQRAAVRYGMDVEELMVALLQIAAGQVDQLLGDAANRRGIS
jgi:hypothetical protein